MNSLILNFDAKHPHTHYSAISNHKADLKYFMVNNGTKHSRDIREFVDMEKAAGRNPQYFEYSKPIPTGRLFMDLFTWAMNDVSINNLIYSDSHVDSGAEVEFGLELIEAQKCIAFGHTKFKPVDFFTFNGKKAFPVQTFSTPFVLNMDVFRQATRSAPIFNAISSALQTSFPFNGEANFELFFSELNTVLAPMTKPHSPLLAF